MKNEFANAKPYLFDRSFDDPTTVKLSRKKREEEEAVIAAIAEAAQIEAETPPAPTFSEEELAIAKAAAFEEGRQAGFDDARDEISAQVTSYLQLITGQLAVLHDKQQLANETHVAKLAQITGEIIAKLLPFYAHSHGVQEIVTFVRDCITPILDDSRVVIRLPAEIKDSLEDQLQQVADEAGFEGRLVVIADATLAPSDAKVDWDGGGAERNWNDIWAEIDEAIQHATHLANVMQDDAENSALTDEPSELSALEKIIANSDDTTETDHHINENEGDDELGSGEQNGG